VTSAPRDVLVIATCLLFGLPNTDHLQFHLPSFEANCTAFAFPSTDLKMTDPHPQGGNIFDMAKNGTKGDIFCIEIPRPKKKEMVLILKKKSPPMLPSQTSSPRSPAQTKSPEIRPAVSALQHCIRRRTIRWVEPGWAK